MGINFEVIRILRLLRKTDAIYLLLLYQDRPVRVVGVARLLEIDRVTGRGQLRSLVPVGLAARPDLLDGCVLTGHGRQLVLVTILESDAPAPPLNADRPLSDCDYQECRMLTYRACPHRRKYPREGSV